MTESFPSRRTFVVGLAGVLGTAACGNAGTRVLANTEAPTMAQGARRKAGSTGSRQGLPLSHFGIDRFSKKDQWTQLKNAFLAAHEERFDLFADADANYRHDGPLKLDGVSLNGQGCTFTALSDGAQVLVCLGDGWRLANLRLLGAARARTANPGSIGILIGDGKANPATQFTIENVAVGAVGTGYGVGGAGFLFDNASRGRIVRAVVRDSLADGIHITNGSRELVFESPLSERTGDDGFAVVSYRNQGQVCRDIQVSNGISRDSAARGFSVVGGKNVIYTRPLVERSSAAGAYLYGEGAYDTFGVSGCNLIAPRLRDCVTGRNRDPGFSNAAIIIGGRDGSDFVDGATLLRGAVDCMVTDPTVEGAGAACWAGISTHEYAIRPKINGGVLTDLTPTSGSFRPNGVEIGGQDVVIDRIRMNNVAGIPIVVTRTASGNCRIDHTVVTRGLTRPGPIRSFIYADPAPKLHQAIVSNGVFSGIPDRLALGKLGKGGLILSNNNIR